MESTARKVDPREVAGTETRPSDDARAEALRALVEEVKADAQRDARRYLEETLVPGGGE